MIALIFFPINFITRFSFYLVLPNLNMTFWKQNKQIISTRYRQAKSHRYAKISQNLLSISYFFPLFFLLSYKSLISTQIIHPVAKSNLLFFPLLLQSQSRFSFRFQISLIIWRRFCVRRSWISLTTRRP